MPNGIRGKKAYIYRNLMSGWYSRLIAKHRYDADMAKQLRADWLKYMSQLEISCTSGWLAAEAESEFEREKYNKQYNHERRELEIIEDAFAGQIGQEAVAILSDVRLRDFDSFDRAGRNLAPEGFRYFPISFSPYVDGLVPKK